MGPISSISSNQRRAQPYRPHESFWRRRMWFSVKGIGHVATSGTQTREVICQICKSNMLLPWCQTHHIDSMARDRQRWWFHSLSRIIILAPAAFLANRHSTTTNECNELYPPLPSLGLNAQTSFPFPVHGTFPLNSQPWRQLHQG